MKGNFWRKIFRKGYNAHGYHSAQYNGTMSKQDARSSRARTNRLMDEISPKFPEEEVHMEDDQLIVTGIPNLQGPYAYYFDKDSMENDKDTPENLKRYIGKTDNDISLGSQTADDIYTRGFNAGLRKRLTIKDIERIITIENDMIEQYDRAMLDQMSDEEYYTEMLRRFYE